MWSELDRLRAGPSRKGVVPIEPVLRASIKFFGRHKGGFIRDGVLLVLLPAPSKCPNRSTWLHNGRKYCFSPLLRFQHQHVSAGIRQGAIVDPVRPEPTTR